MDVTFFRTHMLTKGFSGAELEKLQGLLADATFDAGEPLVVEGTAPAGLLIVAKGQVRVTKKDSGGSERAIVDLDGPTVLGELELISGQPGFATARALTPVRAFLLSTEAFEDLVNANDPVATKIIRNTARVVINRLAETNSRMVALTELANY
jgi:thioredoxin reductase (NADPH)